MRLLSHIHLIIIVKYKNEKHENAKERTEFK